jgi:hypothetical protein
MLRLCWIDVYLEPSDHILIDVEKNFVSRKFRQFVTSMAIFIKSISIEAHWSIDVVKRYHVELRRAYKMIVENLNKTSFVSTEIELQMIIKIINDIIDLDELILILLIFEIYSRIHAMNSSISAITQRTKTIEKVMSKVKIIRTKRQIADALNTRNESNINSIHDLFLNVDVLVWREDNATKRDK